MVGFAGVVVGPGTHSGPVPGFASSVDAENDLKGRIADWAVALLLALPLALAISLTADGRRRASPPGYRRSKDAPAGHNMTSGPGR